MKTQDLVMPAKKVYSDLTVNEKINLKNNMHYSGLLWTPCYSGQMRVLNVTSDWCNGMLINQRTKTSVMRGL